MTTNSTPYTVAPSMEMVDKLIVDLRERAHEIRTEGQAQQFDADAMSVAAGTLIWVLAELAAKEKIAQGYYNEASDGWSKFRDAERELAAANARIHLIREQYEKAEVHANRLNELLCVIHRDGGHYIYEHGEARAYVDAMEKVNLWKTLPDELVAANARAEQEHDIRIDRETMLEIISTALAVRIEPHQTFDERLGDAARTAGTWKELYEAERKAREDLDAALTLCGEMVKATDIRAEAAEKKIERLEHDLRNKTAALNTALDELKKVSP